MRHLRVDYLVGLVLAILWVVLSGNAWSQPEAHGLPTKLTSLTDLTPVMERVDMTAADKTIVLVTWLELERAEPSFSQQGLGGGDIYSGYIQAQMIKALAELGDPVVIDQELSAARPTDEGVLDALRIVLGLKGDRRQIKSLIRILNTHQEPDFRAMAAKALGRLGAKEAEPSLRVALQDEYSCRAGNSLGGTYMAYPVREAAVAAFRMLKEPKVVSEAEKRSQEIALILQESHKKKQYIQPQAFTDTTETMEPQNPPDNRRIAATSIPEQERHSMPGSNPVDENKSLTTLYLQLSVGIGGATAALTVAAFLAVRIRNSHGNGSDN